MDITKTNNLQEIPATEELNKLCRTADTIRPGDYFLHGSDLLRVASLNSEMPFLKTSLTCPTLTSCIVRR